ncbi:MAG TPA: hypothetical protein VGD40_24845 [Chryseosolibacter sp.]
MKTKLIIAAVAIVGFFSTQVQAQIGDEAKVKILPSKAGILKVHYAMEISEPITVRFFNREGVLATDVISGQYDKGLMKRYNVKNITSKDFWVEVSSAKMTVTHHVVPSKDQQTFAAYLEKTTYNYPVVASNN